MKEIGMSRIATAFVAALFVATEAAGASGETLADAIAAHQAAIDTIDTIYLRFEINTDLYEPNLAPFAPPGKIVGEYWRSRGSELIAYSGPGGKESVYRSAQTITLVGDYVDPKTSSLLQTGSITPAGKPVYLRVSPWRLALFALDSNKGTGSMGLAEHIHWLPGKAGYKVTERLGVIMCAGGAVSFQLDPRYNYLIRSRRSFEDGVKTQKKGQVRLEIAEEVMDYAEVHPGIYFPKEVVIEQKLAGELECRKTCKFSSIRVNMPLEPDLFKPKYKDGTIVHDEIRSTTYRVNALGERVGPETNAAKIAVAPGTGPEREQGDRLQSPSQPTSEEERRWGWWLAPMGGILIFCGFGIMAWRRKRNAG